MSDIGTLITRWRDDPGGTYRTWFLWEERLKNFRSIRRGILQVVEEIESGTFGNVYKGSSLETVVGAIAEQRQIFKGADHAFLWKPKLRIPDIYESRRTSRVRALPRRLRCCDGEPAILGRSARSTQEDQGARPGRGEPPLLPPPDHRAAFNTAIVKGLQRADRRRGASSAMGRLPRDARRHPPPQRAASRAPLERSRRCRRAAVRCRAGRYAAPPRGWRPLARAGRLADLARVRRLRSQGGRPLATPTRSQPHRSAGLAARPWTAAGI